MTKPLTPEVRERVLGYAREGVGASGKPERATAVEPEVWLPCPDYEGVYEVSSLGSVRNATTGRTLALHPDRTGYLFVGLTREGKRTSKTVHRLVCRAFHGESRPPHREAAHIDGSRVNNRASNLEWVGKIQNHFHRRAHGTTPSGERHPQAKLTDAAVLAIRATRGLRAEVAARYGISKDTVTDVRRQRTWKHL